MKTTLCTILLVTITSPFVVISCPDGWIDGLDLGCIYFGNQSTSWLEASDFCEKQNGSLVEVLSNDENELLSLITSIVLQYIKVDGFWIGLDDISHESIWEWEISRSEAEYFSWSSGRPDSEIGNKNDCVFMMPDNLRANNFVWFDYLCELPLIEIGIAPLCQIKDNTIPTTSTPFTSVTPTSASSSAPPFDCPRSEDEWEWVEFNGHCYKYVDMRESWTTAEAYCSQINSHLVSIHSKLENEFIANLTNFDLILLGGFVNGSPSVNDWEWSDGTSWDYDYWFPDWPIEYSDSKIYVRKSDFGYRWYNNKNPDNNFVCKL